MRLRARPRSSSPSRVRDQARDERRRASPRGRASAFGASVDDRDHLGHARAAARRRCRSAVGERRGHGRAVGVELHAGQLAAHAEVVDLLALRAPSTHRPPSTARRATHRPRPPPSSPAGTCRSPARPPAACAAPWRSPRRARSSGRRRRTPRPPTAARRRGRSSIGLLVVRQRQRAGQLHDVAARRAATARRASPSASAPTTGRARRRLDDLGQQLGRGAPEAAAQQLPRRPPARP